jgi:hypothetical protein
MSDIDNVLNNVDAMNEEPVDEVNLDTPKENFEADTEEDLPTGGILEQLAMDEPICQGGPTRQAVEDLKAKLPPGTRLMFTGLTDGSGILWKTVNRGEWKKIIALLKNVTDDSKREDVIFSKISIFPELTDQSKIDELPAGAIATVMQEFYLHSGFTPAFEALAL